MTLLETICKELGVEIGEIWQGNDGFRYCILSNGDIERYEEETSNGCLVLNAIWKDILIGELKPKWKPENNQGYYYPRIDFRQGYAYTTWERDLQDIHRFINNMVFRTKDEAIEKTNEILKILKDE